MDKNFDTDFNKETQSSESLTSLDLGKIHFRCPDCSKLFSTHASNIQNERPEFTCNSCSTEFWISFPEALSMSEVIGHKVVDKTKSQFSTSLIGESSVPKKETPLFSKEVHKEKFETSPLSSVSTFGNNDFVEEKTKDSSESSASILDDLKDLIDEVSDTDMEFVGSKDVDTENVFSREPDVSDMWGNVLDDYMDLSLHDEFINFCKEQDDIKFAAQKYQSMLDVNQHDQISKSYLNKIKLSTTIQAQNESAQRVEKISSNSSLGAFAAAAIGLGALFVVLGFSFVQLKNLVGLGIAIIFFTFAVQALLYKGE